jgi:hypothetical protein
MTKLIAIAVASLFAVSAFAQAPKAPEKAPAVKSEAKAPETKGDKAAPKADAKKGETVKK